MRLPKCSRLLLGAALIASVNAQTRLDLRTQVKDVDLSGVPTKPFQTGTVLPATCSVGATFFKSDAPAGKNFYGCTAPNVWTVQTPPDLPKGAAGQLLSNDGADAAWVGIGGDVSGTASSLTVQALQGRSVSSAAPADGNALQWNSATNQWAPATVSGALAGDAAGQTGSTVVKGLQGRAVAAAAPTDGQALRWSQSANQWEPGLPGITLSGDASGAAGNTTVRALQGRAVSTSTPSDGQGLKWNAASNQWEPGSPNTTLSGDTSGAAGGTRTGSDVECHLQRVGARSPWHDAFRRCERARIQHGGNAPARAAGVRRVGGSRPGAHVEQHVESLGAWIAERFAGW